MLRELLDVKEPIKAYFKRLKKCVEFTADATDADIMTPKTQMKIMLPSIERVADFKQHVREWKRKTTKTPELFQTHFIEAYEEILNDEAGEEETTEEANNTLTSEQLQQILNSMGVNDTPNEQANISTDCKLLELIEKLTEKVSRLEGNIKKTSDQTKNTKQHAQPRNGRNAWRKVAPKSCEPLEKVVDGKIIKK